MSDILECDSAPFDACDHFKKMRAKKLDPRVSRIGNRVWVSRTVGEQRSVKGRHAVMALLKSAEINDPNSVLRNAFIDECLKVLPGDVFSVKLP